MINPFIKRLDNASSPWLRLSILQTTFLRDDAIYIIKESFSELTKRDYFKYIDQKLFYFLVDYTVYARDEIIYLLNSNHSVFHLLTPKQLSDLIRDIPEVLDYVLARFYELDLNNQTLVRDLTLSCINDEDKFLRFAAKIFASKNNDAVPNFIRSLAQDNLLEDYSVLKPLISDARNSSVPTIMSSNVFLDNGLRNFLVDNFMELLELEKKNKMGFIDDLKYDLEDDIKAYYDYLLKLVSASNVPKETIGRLNILLANGGEDFIKDYIGDNDVSYLKAGSTAQAFRIGEDKVLKFAKMKHIPDSVYEHFLLAPTERKIIRDDSFKPILYIEKQDYLSQVYNGIPLGSDDYNNFFEEIKKQHLIVRDPHCLGRYADNFGFLRDYHDATLVGVSSHEELPDWFKRRPLVIFDIDMIIQDKTKIRKLK